MKPNNPHSQDLHPLLALSFTTQGITYGQQDWGNTKFHKLCDKDTMAYNLDSLYNFPLWAKPADRLFSCHCTYECI